MRVNVTPSARLDCFRSSKRFGGGAAARKTTLRRTFRTHPSRAVNTLFQGFLLVVASATPNTVMSEYYRSDGVRITHDPYASGMAEKYGKAGETDSEGFDPYADTVGPGIYGGKVKRNEQGEVVYGKQYQDHNPNPGPIYAGGGYTEVNKALRRGEQALATIFERDPSLVNEISTGGATPLHMCGMGNDNQYATAFIIKMGGNIEALDTYGYTALHRMASNNLAVGAEALLIAGANPNQRNTFGETPLQTALQSRAIDVVRVLKKFGAKS